MTKQDNNSWEKKDIRFKAVEYGTCDLQQISAIDRIITKKLKAQRKELLGKVKEGRICLSCGGKKETNLTSWCSKCLEEN